MEVMKRLGDDQREIFNAEILRLTDALATVEFRDAARVKVLKVGVMPTTKDRMRVSASCYAYEDMRLRITALIPNDAARPAGGWPAAVMSALETAAFLLGEMRAAAEIERGE